MSQSTGLSRESHIEGLKLAFRSCWQTRFWYLTEPPENDVYDMLKALGIKKENMRGAMALVGLLRTK